MTLISWVIHYRSNNFANERVVFPLKKNFIHWAVWLSCVNVTGDGMETSNLPQWVQITIKDSNFHPVTSVLSQKLICSGCLQRRSIVPIARDEVVVMERAISGHFDWMLHPPRARTSISGEALEPAAAALFAIQLTGLPSFLLPSTTAIQWWPQH